MLLLMILGGLAQERAPSRETPVWSMPYMNHFKCIQRCATEYNMDKAIDQPMAAKYYYPCTELCICQKKNVLSYP